MSSIRARPDRRAIAIAAALAASTLACSRELPAPIPAAGPDGAEPRRGGVLELATFGDVRAIDPANVSDGLAPQILEALFAGLVDYDLDGKIQPDIAERWVVEDDGKTFRFFLREGVRFHDGDEVTADDVKRSVVRALHPSAPNPYSTYYASIAGYADFASKKTDTLAGVEVEGKYVVTFRLKEPDAMFLYVLAMLPPRPVCKSAGDRYSDAWHPCGAGPFKLPPDGWQRGHTLTVVRHEGYFRAGLPYLDAVRWTFLQNPSSQTLRFLRGELDVIKDLSAADLLRFQADPRWKPFGEYDADRQILGEAMNVRMPPFDDVEIRRAVSKAIDRDALQKVRAANLRATNQAVPPGVFGHDPTLEGQRYDYEAALEHMRRAGYPYDPVTKTGGWPDVVPYTVYKMGLQDFTAQVLKQQLERIGIRIELRVVNYPTFIALRGRRDASPFGPGFWMNDYLDAMSFLEPLFHSKSIADEDSNNWSFYSNPRVDELLDRAHKELDDDRRKKLYTEVQRILVDDAPWAFTQSYRFYTQRQAYVRGHRTHPMWVHDLSRAWLDRAAGSVAGRAIFSKRSFAALLGTSRTDAPARAPHEGR
jgi:peptide/nickel transport system substrate-binding protein